MRFARGPGLALLGAVVMLTLAPSAATAATPFEIGVHNPLEEPFQERDPDNAYASARSIGIGVIRVPVQWAEIAPERPSDASDPGDPAYDWEKLDRTVERIRAAGLEPLLVFNNPPLWVRVEDGDGTKLLRPDADGFATFAGAAAKRYDGGAGKPRVRDWETWNEANITAALDQGNVGDVYREMNNGAYREIKQVHGDNVVIAGGLAPFGGPNGGTPPMRFMRALFCLDADLKRTCDARTRMDAWSHHPYTSGGPTHKSQSEDAISLGDMPAMRRFVLAAKDRGRIETNGPLEFWVTEFSWDTQPPDPRGVPLDRHARWVAEAMYRLWKLDVRMFVWFQLRDAPEGDSFGSTWQGGAWFRTTESYANERKKPVARVFRFPFAAVPAGRRVTVWGRTPGSRAGRVTIQRRKGRRWVRVARPRANRFGVFRVRLRGVRGATLRARARGATALPFQAVTTPDVPVNPFGG